MKQFENERPTDKIEKKLQKNRIDVLFFPIFVLGGLKCFYRILIIFFIKKG